MSSDDIVMVSQVLLGISNPDKNIRTEAQNKLQELNQNLGALCFCLIQIISLEAKTDQENLVKTSALVILRKILDNNENEKWEKCDAKLKEEIKTKILRLFCNEKGARQKYKLGEVISQIFDLVSSNEENWPDWITLISGCYSLNPNDAVNILEIDSLLKITTNIIGFIFDTISKNYKLLIDYLVTIFNCPYLNLKVTAINLISELISFGKKSELQELKPWLMNCLKTILQAIEENNEDQLKVSWTYLINMTSVEPSLWKIHFQDMYTLMIKIIDKKDYWDEKIRELAFEVIINYIEEKPEILYSVNGKTKNRDPEVFKRILKNLLETIYKYSLEFDREIDPSWETPTNNSYEDVEPIAEEIVIFSQGCINRLVDCLGVEETMPILSTIIEGLLAQNDWSYKYLGLYTISSLSLFDDEMATLEKAFELIFSLTNHQHSKVRFLAIHSIDQFASHFNPSFQKKYINRVLPLLMDLFVNEKIWRTQCELIEALTSFIQFTTSENLLPFVPKLYNLLFTEFTKDIPVILRKSITGCILEITATIEEECLPYADKSFDILWNYLISAYQNKTNKILFGSLIECLTTIGPYAKEKYLKIIPNLVNMIIFLVQGIDSNNDPIRLELQNSIERLMPTLQENFKDLINSLIKTVFALLRIQPKMAISSAPDKAIDFNNLLEDSAKEENDIKQKEFKTSETDDFVNCITLLNTIIESLEKDFIPFIDEAEELLLPLIKYKYNPKIRNKVAKILPNIMSIIIDKSVIDIKSRKYLEILLAAINLETDKNTCKKLFTYLNDVLACTENTLSKDEINKFFNQIMVDFENVEKKRLTWNENKKKKKQKSKDDDSEDENLEDWINEDIKQLEDIQTEISDLIGTLFKTHNNLCDDVISVILTSVLPKYLSVSSSTFEAKMALYITDDMIEYLGMDKFPLQVINDMFKEWITFAVSESHEIRQPACYGIGIFAKCAKNNFDPYANDLINALKGALKFSPHDEEDKESWGLAHDNIIASFGKILSYQGESVIVKNNWMELISLWIEGLPIVYDDTERTQQHEWWCEFVLTHKEMIPINMRSKTIKTLTKIYNSKSSTEEIDEKVEKIFETLKIDDEFKKVIEEVYQTAEQKIKNKIEMLIK